MSVRSIALAFTAVLALAAPAAAEKIRVGVTAGPHAQILEQVKPVAAQRGLEIEIVEFSDYVVPNAALAAGELQANSFQHQPYLDNQKADRGYAIESVAPTVTFPLGIYSRKYKKWDEVPAGGIVAIQNDPTNGGRALLLLRDKGAITLKPNVGLKPTLLDIASNDRKLKFVEIDAAQAPRALDDVAAAAVNTNYAVTAKLDPTRDALLLEDPINPYVNVIAIRSVDRDKPWVKILVDAYRTPATKSFIETTFKGALLPSW